MSLRVKYFNSKLQFKTCARCKKTYPRDEEHFYRLNHRTTKGSYKYYSYCITCEKDRKDEWRKQDVASGNKRRRQKNIYLLKKDTSKNYGRAVENLLMVVCLETMKNFLSVGKIKKKFMV